MKKTTLEILLPINPCTKAREWMAEHPDPEEAWQSCTRQDWVFWLFSNIPGAFESELRAFARWCALSCLDNWPDPPQVVLDWLMTGDEQYRSAAESAAWSAARSAADSAAENAAENAARSAAWSATWSEAWSAADNAARSAAGSAAYSAAWSEAQSVAWSATWRATWSATWSAALNHLRTLITWDMIRKELEKKR